MPTLELTIQRKTDIGYPIVAALTRLGGFLPLRREGTLNLDFGALPDIQYDPLAYGVSLGQALFVDGIHDTYREGLASGEALRVLLTIEAPDLRTIDWHRLAAPVDGNRWRLLAIQQNTPFSLAVPSPASTHFPAIGRRDLRALLLVAGPKSLSGDYQLEPFDVPATIESTQAALGDIPCDVLKAPSLDTLCAALTVKSYTILHIVCHGAVAKNGETVLYFPKDERGAPTPSNDLLDRLASLRRLPHFVFLSTCESGLPQSGLGSLAQRLIRGLGLPAVLAMTDRVSIATAGAIAAPFYTKLYEHGLPDLALVQSLAGLQGAHDLTVPALFSRLGDRPLFDDSTYTQNQIIQNYMDLIEKRNRYLVSDHLLNTPIELRQVFSMLNVCELKADPRIDDRQEKLPEPPISFDRMLDQNNKIVLLGEAGSGKSTLLQFLALNIAEESGHSLTDAMIPILISLRSYSGSQRLDEFLLAQFHLDYVPESEARTWLESGRLWVMLDGLDEVYVSNRKQVVQAIQQFTGTPYGKKTHLIVTSRLAGYLEYRLIGAEFIHFELQALRQSNEIQTYMTAWLAVLQGKSRQQAKQQAEEFINSFHAKQGTSQILNTPLLLRLSANSYAQSRKMLTDRSQLYQEYIKLLLDQAVLRQADPNRFYRSRLEQGLESLAWVLQTTQSRDMESLANTINRESNSLDGQELIRYICNEIGLLRIDYGDGQLKGKEQFGFVHQSFQEYLVGKRLALRWNQDEGQTWDFLKNKLHHHAWYDSILFMSGQLSVRARSRLVQRVLQAKSLYERPLCRDFLLAAAICRNAPVEPPLRDHIETGLQRLLSESTFRWRDGAGYDAGNRPLYIPVILAIVVSAWLAWREPPTGLKGILDFLWTFFVLEIVLNGIFIFVFWILDDSILDKLLNPVFGRRKFSLLNKRVEQILKGNLQVVIEAEKSFKISAETTRFLEAKGIDVSPKATDQEILHALETMEASQENIEYLFQHLKNNFVTYWDDRSPDERPIAEEAIRLLVYFGARFDLKTNLKIAKQISSYLSESWSTIPDAAYQALDQLAARITEMEVDGEDG